MARIGAITMSMLELDRLKTIQAVSDGNLKPRLAAQRLDLTTRQVQRLVNQYRIDGAAGLISRKRDRPGNRQLMPGIGALALGIIRERYADFGPTLACEKLRECHDLKISKETVRKLMTVVGLWIPRHQRPPKIYQPRNRRPCLGELIQIDGSDHRWFEDRAPACTVLVFVDDATSRLLYLHFTFSESTFSYFEATRAYLEQHGKPLAFYSDKATVFRVSQKNAANGAGHTQFARALFELNIDLICANSSQAKGRVERMNLSLQDRLVKELRLLGISTMAEANAYAATFIADYNGRFAKPPRNDFNTHRPLRVDEDLSLIFTVRATRCVSTRLSLQHDKNLYLLADTVDARAQMGKDVDVFEFPDGHIEIRANGVALAYAIYDQLPVVNQSAVVENKRLGHVLQVAQLVQQKRDNRRGYSSPAHTHTGAPTAKVKRVPGTKSSSNLDMADIIQAIDMMHSKAVSTTEP
ncbi:MAG: ISNCY family transposase [Candidatus Sungbacteria bacterium]|uniref:ISNCY family transposase n=1 Tax=Candidatus Sungiibacteriota bacterium TaxID=2750080 RepID=A0A932QXY3_9BACT|nr:ISNCY family transposase [Candidatus Sungbacteria bacterium]